MNSRKPRWTEEEDKTLIEKIKKSPHNISSAIRETTRVLNRTYAACEQRWYTVLSNPSSKKYAGVLFTGVGYTSIYPNRKDNRYDVTQKPIKTRISIIKRIKNIITSIINKTY